MSDPNHSYKNLYENVCGELSVTVDIIAMTVSVVVMQRVIRPGTRTLCTQRDVMLAQTKRPEGRNICNLF
jgi:hypothetical protein